HAERERADSARVFRHILADAAIAAGYGQLEEAVPVARRHREAIHLQFGNIAVGSAAQQIPYPFIESAEFGLIERIIEAEHDGVVRNLTESLARFASYAGGR